MAVDSIVGEGLYVAHVGDARVPNRTRCPRTIFRELAGQRRMLSPVCIGPPLC